jgi:[protein-PII] uridylyltransferase
MVPLSRERGGASRAFETAEEGIALESNEADVSTFRRYLKLESERLRIRHRLGLGGAEIAAGRSDQVDVLVKRVCQSAAAADRTAQRELRQCAVVALGGYGRGELAPHSDVDILFLHPGRSSAVVAAFVERVLQILWDVGLSVGHSYRSIRECVAEARSDLHSRTALAEARLLTGSADLFQALLLRLETDLRRSRRATEGFLEQMRIELRERFEKYGRAVCVLEPNVKEGPGGLRDLHAMLWVSHARFGTRGLVSLRAQGLLTEDEYVVARRAHDFLSRVRNEAHFATGRKTDLLLLDLQGELAQSLGYRNRGGLLASELLMRDYFRRASELHRLCHTFLLTHLGPPPPRFLPALRLRRPVEGGFDVRRGALHARGDAGLRGGPGQVMEAFAAAQAEGVPLSEELKLAIRSRGPLLDHAFRSSREAGRAFLHLLERRGRVGETLRDLHDTGLLGRLLPEWSRITFLVQHDFFHKYTVDEHTLKAIEALDEVAAGQDSDLSRLGAIFDELTDVVPLYLGMLLHDIGKGRGQGHVGRGVKIARRILERLHVEREPAEKVLFLVGAHLEMSQISQRRDLSEPSLIEAFASRVGTLEKLNLLLLLTYADHRGVGPNIWTEWKASLLWELYTLTRSRLAGHERGGAYRDHAAWERDRVAADLGRHFPPEEVERHFTQLPERYLRTTDAARMVWHFRLVHGRGDRPVAFDWASLGEGQGTELVVTADDRPGLFARLAGTLTAHGIDIMSVDLFSRQDGTVIDTFRIGELPGHRPVGEARRARLETALTDAVTGRLDVPHAVEKWRGRYPARRRRHWGRAARSPAVRFDQEASAVSTVVEVKAQDQPGLAYTIAETLAELGLDITFARVATSKALAFDVFYVRDERGRKLGPEACAKVEAALLAALGGRARTNG